MEKIIIRDNQFYDVHAPEYKLQLEFCEKSDITFVVVKQISEEKDERVEEIHLDKEQVLNLSLKLNNFIIENGLKKLTNETKRKPRESSF